MFPVARSRWRTLVLPAALLLVLSACGGSSQTGLESAEVTTGEAGSATTADPEASSATSTTDSTSPDSTSPDSTSPESTEPATTGTSTPTTASSATGAAVAPVVVDGEPLAPMPGGVTVTDPSTDPAIGTQAPTLTGTDLEGRPITIEPNGSPKIVYFLAHWCPHCQREVPVIQQLIDAGSVPAGLEIHAVSTAVDAGRGNFPPAQWLADEGFSPPVMRDDATSSALVGYGAGGFPYAVYLDAEHRVVVRTAGELGAEAMVQLWQMTAEF